ncbi:MAG TPA: hypothetical protein V6C88_18840, partial [Chroococcidiopsis sp.]
MNQPLNQPSAPTPKPPLSEQIVEILIKVIRPGGITGGGLGAAWFLLVASDIPKAIASAGIGVMLSYGAKLLQPIHKRIERGAEWTGEAVGQAAENLMISTILRGEAKYLQCQAWDCQQYKPEGVAQYDDTQTLLLEEVFVPLRLDSHALLPGLRGREQPTHTPATLAGDNPCPPDQIWD